MKIKAIAKRASSRAEWLTKVELIPVSLAWRDYKYHYSPPDSPVQGYPSLQHFIRLPWQFAVIHLYSWVERGKYFIQKHNTMTPQSLKPRPLKLESSPLAIRSWTILTNTWLPYSVFIKSIFHRSMITLICQSTFPCKPFQQHNSILDPMNQWQSPQN